MNTHTFATVASLALATALSAPLGVSAAPTPGETVPMGYYASKVTVPVWNFMWERMESQDIATGITRAAVEKRLGKPKQMLSPDVWVYDNCRPNYNQAQLNGCSLLVVTFDTQGVSELKFVNRALATQIAAQLETTRASTYAVAK